MLSVEPVVPEYVASSARFVYPEPVFTCHWIVAGEPVEATENAVGEFGQTELATGCVLMLNVGAMVMATTPLVLAHALEETTRRSQVSTVKPVGV